MKMNLRRWTSFIAIGFTFLFFRSAAFAGDANWDGQFDAQGLDSAVNAIAVGDNGNIYVGGAFTHAGGLTANYIAVWNGSSWSNLGSGMDYAVEGIALSGSDVYAVSIGGLWKWDGSSWTRLGRVNFPTDQQYVHTVAINGGDVYIGGRFTSVNGVSANHIAKWDGSSWSSLGNGVSGDTFPDVQAIAFLNGEVYVGGKFNYANGIFVSGKAKWDGANWSALGSIEAWDIRAIVSTGGFIYAGRAYGSGVWANGLAKWDGTTWSKVGSGGN